MAPCTLTNITVPETCIITSADVVPEGKNVLRRGGVPDGNGNRRTCNNVGDTIGGPSTMNTDQYPSRHTPSSGVTDDMMSYNGISGYQPETL